MDKWGKINGALLYKGNPKNKINLDFLSDSSFWKKNRDCKLIRYISNFDEYDSSEWWYIIKDTVFDIKKIKSNYRCKINKSKKFFEVKIIDPSEYKEELFELQKSALMGYPQKYRPVLDKEKFIKGIDSWNRFKKVYAAFKVDTNELCGYARFFQHDEYCYELSTLKSNPQYEKYQINACIISFALEDLSDVINNGGFIFDGERNLIHETSFQDYLCKYFEFRKAYCKLNVIFRNDIKIILCILYPIRNIFKDSKFYLFNRIYAALKMIEITRYPKLINKNIS